MSDTTLEKAKINYEANIGDYFNLLKPRVMILVVFTALVGIIAAPVDLHPFTIFVSIIFIALGGGAFLNKKIMEEILKNHISFWLKWNDKVLIQRIKNSQKRPLAFNLSDNELTNLIKKRSIIYSKAKFKINCNNLTKNQIVNKIMNIYEKN